MSEAQTLSDTDAIRAKVRAALDLAIDEAKGLTSLGSKVGASKAVVWAWRDRGNVPPEYAPLVEAAVGGVVRCEDLCPSVNWELVRGTAKTANKPAPAPAPAPTKEAA